MFFSIIAHGAYYQTALSAMSFPFVRNLQKILYHIRIKKAIPKIRLHLLPETTAKYSGNRLGKFPYRKKDVAYIKETFY